MIKPYFPYGIRVAANGCYKETSIIKELFDNSFLVEDYWKHTLEIPYDTDEYKLVLHPVTVEHFQTPLRVNSKKLIVADTSVPSYMKTLKTSCPQITPTGWWK